MCLARRAVISCQPSTALLPYLALCIRGLNHHDSLLRLHWPGNSTLHMQNPLFTLSGHLQLTPSCPMNQTLQSTRGDVLHPGRISLIFFHFHPTQRPAECGRHLRDDWDAQGGGRLTSKLTVAEIGNGVMNKAKYRVTAPRVRKRNKRLV